MRYQSAERWQRANELFGDALERAPGERRGFLSAACEDDPALVSEVESLLAAYESAGELFDTPAFRFAPPDEPAAPPALLAGRRLGPYEVVALLGSGGMGEVYRARDPRLGREVAVKVLPYHALANPRERRRFEQEARAVGALNHPNVVAVFDVGSEDGVPYVVSELLLGQTLAERLEAGSLSLAEALDCARQIAAGLAAAHEQGIIHRDLKPANLFLTADGRLKILDFGLAKCGPCQTGATKTSDPSFPGVVFGTAAYMSPEQVRGQAVDSRSDVFSFGAVLFELLAGRRAFLGASAVETWQAILTQEPPGFAELGRDLPASVEDLVRRCLRKEPAHRIEHGRALSAALAELARSGAGDRRRTATTTVVSAPRAVAVLPFRDLTGDPDNAHLGLGLADATITELARLKGLLVRPTSAVLGYLASPVTPLEAARQLGVSALVEGTFQRCGVRLRLSVQLVSGVDGHQLWATKIDTAVDDLFAMQDQVSRLLAQALDFQLSPRVGSRCGEPRRGECAPGLCELYFKGRVHLLRESLDDSLRAVDCFDQALRLDPGFALGWAGLADAYSRIAFTFLPEGDWYARAWDACERALALDPELPEARYVRGGRLLWSPQRSWDHGGALADLVPALAARPGLQEAQLRLAVVLHHVGLIDEMEEQLEQALLASPGYSLARQHRGLSHHARGRFAEALEVYQDSEREAPTPWVHYRIALCHIQLDELEAARAAIEQMLRQTPGEPLAHSVLGLLAALAGDRDEARRQVELTVANERGFGHFHHAQYDLGVIHAQLGEPDEAVTWLEAAADNGFPCSPEYRTDALLAPLSGHRAFAALLAELEREGDRYRRLYGSLRAANGL